MRSSGLGKLASKSPVGAAAHPLPPWREKGKSRLASEDHPRTFFRLLYSENLLGRDGEEEVEVGQEAALVVHDQRPAWGLQLISSLIAQRYSYP